MLKKYFTALFVTSLFIGLLNAQTNIAPQGTFTCTGASASFPPSTLNDLNYGTCGTQQMWMSTSNPPSTTPGVDWIQVDFPKSFTIDKIVIHHAQNNTRFLSGATIQRWAGGSWVNVYTFSNLTPACSSTVTFPKFTASRFRLTALQMTTGGQTSNPNFREIEIFDVPTIPNDAQPTALDKPGQAICDNSKDVRVSIQNRGLNNLNNVKINWTVIRNGNTFPVNTYTWNGNLAQNAIASNILVGTFPPGFERNDIFKCWTEDPNGIPDSSAENDTLELLIREGVSGTYNVGGIFDIDFPTMQLAEQFVDSFGAVCDSLVFNIRDGVYYGSLNFNEVFNTAPDRPVIFRAENGNNSNVIIIDTTIIGSQSLITLSSPKNFYFENIQFENGSNSGNVFNVNGEIENLNILNSVLTNSSSSSSTSTNQNVVFFNEAYGSGFILENSEIIGGNLGLNLIGKNEDSLIAGVYLKNNIFNNAYFGGAHLSNTRNSEISGNTFSSNNASGSSSFGLDIIENKGFLRVFGNQIGSASGWPSNGIILDKCEGLPISPGVIYNNFIAVGDSTTVDAYGINAIESAFMNYINNSIAVNHASGVSAALELAGGGANRVINNILANFDGGYGLDYQETAGFPAFESDYNNIYSNGSAIARHKNNTFISINQWSGSIGDDQNSASTAPSFFSSTDLHLCSSDLNNLGIPTPFVSVDIDGDFRNSTNPDIGADEYSPISNLDLGNDTIVCKGTAVLLNGSLNFNDFYNAWSTGDSAAAITVTEPGTYSVVSENVCGISTDTIVVSLSPAASLGSDTNLCANTSLQLDAGVNNATYLWNNGSTSQTINVNTSGIYSVEVIDVDACVTRDTIFITQSQEVSLPSDTSLCGGQSIFLDPGTGPGNYNWSSGQTTPIILANTTGTYSVTFTDLFGCQSNASTNVISTTIPDAEFTNQTIGYTVKFFGKAYPNANYSWDFGDGDTSNLQNPIHYYANPGTYVATLQISNDCGTDFFSKELEVILPGTGAELNANETLNVFPNPAIDLITISQNLKDNFSLQIEDLTGKPVFDRAYQNNGNNIVIDISSLPAGVYLIKAISYNATITKQIIKQ